MPINAIVFPDIDDGDRTPESRVHELGFRAALFSAGAKAVH
jgi:hypothetical protein